MKSLKFLMALFICAFLINCDDSNSSSNLENIDLTISESLPAETEEVSLTSSANLENPASGFIDGGFLREGNVIKKLSDDGSVQALSTLPDPANANLSRSYGSTQSFALASASSAAANALVTPDTVQGFITVYSSSLAFGLRDDQQGIVLSDIEGNVQDYNYNDEDVSFPSGCAFLNNKIYCAFTNGVVNVEAFQTCFNSNSQLLVAELSEGSATEIATHEFYEIDGMKNVTGITIQPGTSNLILSSTGDVFCNPDADDTEGSLAIIDVTTIESGSELEFSTLITGPKGLGQSGISAHNDGVVLFSGFGSASSIHIFDGTQIIELELPEILQGATYISNGVLRGNEILLAASRAPDQSWNRAVSVTLSEDLQSVSNSELIADLASFPLNVVRIQENQYVIGSGGGDAFFIGEN